MFTSCEDKTKVRVIARSNQSYCIHGSAMEKSDNLVRIVTVTCGMVKQNILVNCV